jgi:hypothetical protein
VPETGVQLKISFRQVTVTPPTGAMATGGLNLFQEVQIEDQELH